jgi:hypothetical protein
MNFLHAAAAAAAAAIGYLRIYVPTYKLGFDTCNIKYL